MLRQEQAPNPFIQAIQEVFYNQLAELALDSSDTINEHNIQYWIGQQIPTIITRILITSSELNDEIQLPTGQRINRQNCPTVYTFFLDSLLRMKQLYQADPDSDSVQIALRAFASRLIEANAFKETMDKSKKFILEMRSAASVNSPQRNLSEAGITVQLIRDTFYNEMPNQFFISMEAGFVSRDDLEDLDVYIFLSATAMTLIEIMLKSKDHEGILLLNNKLLTMRNCPREENLNVMFQALLDIKPLLVNLTAQELLLVKYLCIANNKPVPEHLQALQNQRDSAAIKCATTINQISSQVSRLRPFQEIIGKVIQFTLEASPSARADDSVATGPRR